MSTSAMGQLLNKSLSEILQELRAEDTELKILHSNIDAELL